MQSTWQNEGPSASIGDYTLHKDKVLGKGATGTVYRGQHTFSNQPVAIKAIDLTTINDEVTQTLLDNEKKALQMIKSDNTLKLYEVKEEAGWCYLITELIEGVTLKQLLEQRKLSEQEAMSLFRQILAGSVTISRNCVIHRDLKPANIMVTQDMKASIIDFGYCQIIDPRRVMKTFNVGSPSYMSPQAYLRTLYSEKSDSWSLGVILFEMLHGKTLDEGYPIKEFLEMLKTNQLVVSEMIGSHVSTSVKQIIQSALKYQPEDRTSISNMKYQTDVYCLQKRSNSAHTTTHPSQKVPSLATCHSRKQSDFVQGRTMERGDATMKYGSTGPFRNHNSRTDLRSSCSKKNSTVRILENTNQHPPLPLFDITKQLTTMNRVISSGPYPPKQPQLQRRPSGPPAFRQVTVRYL